MAIDPLSTVAGYAGRAVAAGTAQPRPSVESVGNAARVIVSGIVQPKGDTVGVLTGPSRADLGGLEGAGLHTGVSITA